MAAWCHRGAGGGGFQVLFCKGKAGLLIRSLPATGARGFGVQRGVLRAVGPGFLAWSRDGPLAGGAFPTGLVPAQCRSTIWVWERCDVKRTVPSLSEQLLCLNPNLIELNSKLHGFPEIKLQT